MPDKNVKPSARPGSHSVRYVTLSSGIKRWWTVQCLLGSIQKINRIVLDLELAIRSIRSKMSGITLVGWGRRPGSEVALHLAQKYDLPYLALEDGFLRSFGTGEYFPPIALIQDRQGIYYDSRSVSELEGLLNSDADLLDLCTFGNGSISPTDLEATFNRLVAEGLSKYNHAPPVRDLRPGKRILVIDQTEGDMSVVCGGASAQTFEAMLEAALNEHRDATVFVKTHPEVTSGRKSGYLTALLAPDVSDSRFVHNPRIMPLREAIEPASLIRAMDHVYVASSTMGFEALMHGKPVTCFGVPWYAGWGVTDDRQICVRRTQKRSIKELFAAAYVAYTTYLDPLSHAQGSIHDAIDWLVHQKRMGRFLHGDDGKGRVFVYGFQRWKAYNLRSMLALKPDQLIFVGGVSELQAKSPVSGDTVMVWGADVPEDLAALVRGVTGLRILHVEDGFLRSVGLGSDMIKPQSLVFDERGLYFDARQPSNLEHLLQNTVFSDEDLARAADLRRLIVEHGLTKYNLDVPTGVNWQIDAAKVPRVIFVPGQVEDDASIRYGCVDVRTNLDLLKAVRASNSEAWIVFKPHPDVVTGNRAGRVRLSALSGWVDHVELEASVISCLLACDEVHTMTSLTGFDALLRGKRVVTYGQPFYAGWGLTEDRCAVGVGDFGNCALTRRTRRLTLDELVAGVLLRYPVYWDWNLRGFTTCEAVINRLIEERDGLMASGRLKSLRDGASARLMRKAKVLVRAWTSRM